MAPSAAEIGQHAGSEWGFPFVGIAAALFYTVEGELIGKLMGLQTRNKIDFCTKCIEKMVLSLKHRVKNIILFSSLAAYPKMVEGRSQHS